MLLSDIREFTELLSKIDSRARAYLEASGKPNWNGYEVHVWLDGDQLEAGVFDIETDDYGDNERWVCLKAIPLEVITADDAAFEAILDQARADDVRRRADLATAEVRRKLALFRDLQRELGVTE